MKWFKNLHIFTKLMVCFVVILVMTSLAGLFALRQVALVHQNSAQVSSYLVPSIKNAAALQYAILRTRLAYSLIESNREDPQMGDINAYLARQIDAAQNATTFLTENLQTPEGRDLIAKIQGELTQLIGWNKDILKYKQENNLVLMTDTLTKHIAPMMFSVGKDLAALNEHLTVRAQVLESAGLARYESALKIVITSLILAALIGLFLMVTVGRAIARPLHHAVQIAHTVAKGDLSSQIVVDGKDETADLMRSLKEMNSKLISVVQDIRHGAEAISTASSEVSSGNLDLSARTEQQASSLEETASAMEELTSTVKQNADNARHANKLAAAASAVAEEGGAVVQKVVTTMTDIDASSRKIVDIISVIDGIAFQTNILALNAAVEAARAGEQGRGFAVVASEVRNLAQRSASAAKEIKQLIDDSVEKVGEGSSLVAQAGNTMTHVVSSIKQVTDIVAEIAAASQEQSTGLEQINQAISQMDEVTQHNAALVEESSAATQAMQQQTSSLLETVGIFKLSHQGTAAPVQVAVARPAKPVTVAKARPKTLPATSKAMEEEGFEEF